MGSLSFYSTILTYLVVVFIVLGFESLNLSVLFRCFFFSPF